ncbi:hypothetical protein ACFXJ8_01475 [Nonomuraea sp. NPDC059194]|uniref:hypothetical protein n=1 Tax=Nonomuraea sp. NPDC059194 TaxID=3346764 RepID=UPI0036B35B20
MTRLQIVFEVVAGVLLFVVGPVGMIYLTINGPPLEIDGLTDHGKHVAIGFGFFCLCGGVAHLVFWLSPKGRTGTKPAAGADSDGGG